MTAQARVPAKKCSLGSSFKPGTLTRITNGYSRSTLYRTIENAAKMLGNNPSVWHDQLVFVVTCMSFHVPAFGPEWFALVVVDCKVGWMYASDLLVEGV